MRLLIHIGSYLLLMKRAFGRPNKWSVLYQQTMREVEKLGINSIPIVIIVSLFVGAALTIQTDFNMDSPLYPRYLVGLAVRDALLLEFSSSMIALILAGKVGSSIASEMGMMRVTEQIDALEVMGVNSASLLILPKIISSFFFFPILCLISIILGLTGGYLTCVFAEVITPTEYVQGIQFAFEPSYISYAMIKMAFYALIITSVSAYQGYHVQGGAIEVGKASTRAVVQGSILILLANLLLTKIILQ